jgi:hypothetical protein
MLEREVGGGSEGVRAVEHGQEVIASTWGYIWDKTVWQWRGILIYRQDLKGC